MGKKDPRIDAYIARSAEFARPILTHLRAVVHEAVPEVEEAMKWSFPSMVAFEETRRKRIATAVAWMAEGKPQNWKYTK